MRYLSSTVIGRYSIWEPSFLEAENGSLSVLQVTVLGWTRPVALSL